MLNGSQQRPQRITPWRRITWFAKVWRQCGQVMLYDVAMSYLLCFVGSTGT
jgi:hypothetical protein